jgi:hypothetical protein
MANEVLQCKMHGYTHDYTRHDCGCQYCPQYWIGCPRCHGSDENNRVNIPEQLLRRALAALNRAPCFRIPSLNTNSYGIAAEIDDYFHQTALTEQS